MAEHSFQEVMRQFDRMCKANSGCINCPLHQNDYYSDDECHIGAFVRHPEKIEQTVMQWAAENPEPVYPTWREWLIKRGLIDFKPDFKSLSYDPSLDLQENPVIECLNVKASEPIPADIAEKLGIEPKEE